MTGYARSGAITSRTSEVTTAMSTSGFMRFMLNVLWRSLPSGKCPIQTCIAKRHVMLSKSVTAFISFMK
ncbi:MAG: hypothetical protein LBQ19_02985 [Synergistaceae bacterium]|nr:hypothetical protein [Synergistaceae bacterium]